MNEIIMDKIKIKIFMEKLNMIQLNMAKLEMVNLTTNK